MRPTERRTLHFDLSSSATADREYVFHHVGTSLPLLPHTARSCAEARAEVPVLRLIPDDHLTHFVVADLVTDAIAMYWVTISPAAGGPDADRLVHMAVNIPSRGRAIAQEKIVRRRRARNPEPKIHPKLAQYGVTVADLNAVLGDNADNIPEFPKNINDINDAIDAAIALLYHHTSLINLNVGDGGSVPGIIVDDCISPAVTDTMDLPYQIKSEGAAWTTTTMIDSGNPDIDPIPNTVPSDTVQAVMTGPLQDAIAYACTDPELENQQWRYEYGRTFAPYNGSSKTKGPGGVVTEAVRATAEGAAANWAARNLTPSNGLTINADSVTYTSPSTTTNWSGRGIWSVNDPVPVPDNIGDLLTQSQVSVVVSTAAQPSGLISGVLTAAGVDPDTDMEQYTATLASPGTTATGKLFCSLNTGKSGLSYTITVDMGQDTTPIAAGFSYPDPDAPAGVREVPAQLTNATGYGKLSIECTNNWLRHLSACVQYLDSGGTVLDRPANWDNQVPGFLRRDFEPDPNTLFVELVQPVTTVFGITIPNKPVQISVPVWDEVATVRFLWGGLGTGRYDKAVCPIGLTVTCLAELALPVFLMWAGAAVMNSNTVKAIMADKEVLLAVCAAGSFLAAGAAATYIGTAQDAGAAAVELAEKFGPLLLSPATSLGRWVYAQIAESEVEAAVPFVDFALAALKALVTAKQLASTIVEVIESPFVYETNLVRSVTLVTELDPDPQYGKFPDRHDHFTVTVSYDCGTTLPAKTFSLDSTTISDPIMVTFESIPAGGNLNVLAVFYAEDGWQSGQGQSGWISATAAGGVLNTKMIVTTNEPPLDQHSVYMHNEKIGMVGSSIGWLAYPDKPPTATPATPPPKPGKELLLVGEITIAQSPEMVGYCWRATGLNLPQDQPDRPLSNDALWTLQNISVLEHPQNGLSYPKVGFTAQPAIAYDLMSPDGGTGNNFFVDPTRGEFDPDTNCGGGYHLRRLELSRNGPAPAFGVGSDQSFGRFPVPMDRYVYHPQGFVFGISASYQKIFRLEVTSVPVADKSAPMATLASGPGSRDGLVLGPVSIATALDGRLLVLERDNHRIQAFDTFGKPVPYFTDPDDPSSPDKIPTLDLLKRPGTNVLLDLAVEAEGYLYVLSCAGDNSKPANYHVDLYEPDGTLLVTTSKTAAARITVDILRSMYTLNYETFLDASGRPQPSVSQWLPPTPTPPKAQS